MRNLHARLTKRSTEHLLIKKVKFLLYLLNEASCLEDIWEHAGKAPQFFTMALDVVSDSFMPKHLYSQVKWLRYPLHRQLVGPQS
jgi:sarcosine oxidase delta subunit